ncbi:MAG: nucleotidyltransferase domain-containing protein [Chitinophagaceae bacterium]|nr:nucleotidyltransferase domain-containing protein [Chitinophagaceae bacterium]
MNRQETLHTIKSIVHTFLPGAQVLLFGSRARGNDTKYSDYDVLVITQQAFAPGEKINWESKISKTLVNLLRAPFDVILQSNEEINLRKNSKGHIIYYALKDAVEL